MERWSKTVPHRGMSSERDHQGELMHFIPTDFEGVWLIEPAVHRDARGFFLESYSVKEFNDHGVEVTFVQDNHSLSATPGVIRGLHFQEPPCSQAKLIRVLHGAILDVVVDIRKDSPTFGRCGQYELSADNFRMLYVPHGFAHGFCTLQANTEMLYKVDSLYAPTHDRGIRWNDPDLAIQWPIGEPVLSAKDQQLPFLRDIESPF
jgi:dTDP-4-dehydrorhamnose 3,5-epimerase